MLQHFEVVTCVRDKAALYAKITDGAFELLLRGLQIGPRRRNVAFGATPQVVVKNRAIRRILGSRKFRRERCLFVIIPTNTHGLLRLEKIHGRCHELCI